MSGWRNHAWAVVLVTDDDVKAALLTGNTLRKTRATGVILAVLSYHATESVVSDLESVFDLVIFKGIGEAIRDMRSSIQLLMATLNLTLFQRVVAIQPGIEILRQSETLFDLAFDGPCHVMVTEKGDWALAVVKPGLEAYKKAKAIMSASPDVSNNQVLELLGIMKSSKYIPKLRTMDDLQHHSDKQSAIVWVEPCLLDSYISQMTNPTQSQFAPNPPSTSAERTEWIAIVGMSCRFPGANSVDEYWELLNTGRNCSSSPPEDRRSLLDIDENVRANFLKCPVDQFDASFFGISPSEASFLDPQARFLLEVSWEAFEDARIPVDKLRGTSTGVFCGAWIQEYKEAMNTTADTNPSEEFLRKYIGNGFGAAAAKLSFFYGFTGPNVATESACASSMVAVDLASKSLQRRECPIALACGTNIILQFDTKQKVIWAKDGKCKTFDVNADGYARAEGVAVVVLKRYSDAIRDGDRIHGIILGSAASQEGLSKSFGAPTVESEYKAMSEALRAARIDPSQVDYVEAHATGTTVGDPIEAAAIVKAYSSKSPRDSKLLIGSGKTNIGHTESCSGLAGLIKVVLAMKHESIPAHINLTQVNPHVNFDHIPGEITVKPTPWPRNLSKPRIAGVSSFGLTGTDVHLILQEPPEPSQAPKPILDQPHLKIMAVSAKSLPALEQLCEMYASHLDNLLKSGPTTNPLDDFVYTVNTARTHHHQFRKAFLVKDISQAVQLLRQKVSYDPSNDKRSKEDKPPKVCFAFPGIIGSMNFQYVSKLYRISPQFKDHMNQCDFIWLKLFPEHGSLVDSMLANPSWDQQSKEKKPLTFYASYLAVQYSLAMLWKSWEVNPTIVVGHCMGELSACIIAGILSVEDAFKVVACVYLNMTNETAIPGAMLALNCDETIARDLISHYYMSLKVTPDANTWIDIASINTPTQTVVAGPPKIISDFQEYCSTTQNHNIRSKFLEVDFAVHSRAAQPCWDNQKETWTNLEFGSPKVRWISSVTGEEVKESDMTPEFLFRVFRDSVEFTKACQFIKNGFCDKDDTVIIELGLGSALATIMKENMKEVLNDSRHLLLSSFQKTRNSTEDACESDEALIGLLSGLGELYMRGWNVNWEEFHKFEENQRTKVDLPHYPFQRKSFWFERKREKANDENMPFSNLKQVHPLLGGVLPTAIDDRRIYQNWMQKCKTPYIYDHVIGSHVIFPGAGFLEMILATNHMENSSVSAHLIVENFVIHKPLYLSPSEPQKLQCILNATTNRASIHTESKADVSCGRSQWSEFACGTVSLEELPDAYSKNEVDVLSVVNNHVGSQERINAFYSEAAAVGLNFGPAFQSMKRVFKPEENVTLIEVELSTDEEGLLENYVAHPILLDAMFQGFILHSKAHLNKLHVPVKIGKLIWFRNGGHQTVREKFYVHCKSEPSGITKNVSLFSGAGHLLCEMVQPELVPTTVQSVMQAAAVPKALSGTNLLPELYQVTWQPAQMLQMKESSTTKVEWIIFQAGDQFDKKFEAEMKKFGRSCIHLNVAKLVAREISMQSFLNNFMEDRRDRLEGILFWSQGKGHLSQPKFRQILEPLLCISKLLGQSRWKELPRLHVITEGIFQGGDDLVGDGCLGDPDSALLWGYMRTLRVELPQIQSKSIALIKTNDNEDNAQQQCDRIMNEILNTEDHETEIVIRGDMRLVRRLMKDDGKGASPELEIPSGCYTIELPKSKIMKDLKYILKEEIDAADLQENQVEIQVRSASLNFRDVFSVMKPSKYFEGEKTIGLDFSGVVSAVGGNMTKWKVGDPVFGCNWNEGTITSHLVADADMVTRVPKSLTFNEAATLPAVFLTAWHCMVHVADMKVGQRILIHAASGGVGLMAIQLAKYLGLEVFGTAGSDRKRNFVRSLGVQHVFNSRTLDYSSKIQDITGGHGVDMVLNCLTGPGFKEASLDCCKTGGYFVEISKLDIWSVEQVRERRADVNYHVVDVMTLDKQVLADMMLLLTRFLEGGTIQPLPYVRYTASRIVGALSFLQKAKQIGKVIVEMPKLDKESGTTKQLMFNEQSSYVITGGMGAIGMAVAKWMAKNGATTLVLVGRSPPNEKTKEQIEEMIVSGATVVTKQSDISSFDQCLELFKELHQDPNIPPVRGVHHCSGVLSDKLIMNQNWDNFELALTPKVEGAYNLHQVTKDLHLEFFVLYSSISCTFGNVGQSNYSAANCYMDALVEMRRQMNLPGMTINWGVWKAGLAENLTLDWTEAFSIQQGIQTLEKLMNENRMSAVVGNLKFPGVTNLYPKYKTTFLENMQNCPTEESEPHHGNLSNRENIRNADEHGGTTLSELLQNAGASLPVDENLKLIQNCVKRLTCESLGISADEIEVDTLFSDMGMDSLMSIEFTNKLQVEMGKMKLGFVDMEEHGTVNGMTNLVMAIFKDESAP